MTKKRAKELALRLKRFYVEELNSSLPWMDAYFATLCKWHEMRAELSPEDVEVLKPFLKKHVAPHFRQATTEERKEAQEAARAWWQRQHA